MGVLGDANLFIINPKGIIFGKDASLDINASFIGSTANSIKFVDGKQFSAVSPENRPILTISVPLGLGIENDPSTIIIKENLAQSLRNSNIIPENNNLTTDLELLLKLLVLQQTKGGLRLDLPPILLIQGMEEVLISQLVDCLSKTGLLSVLQPLLVEMQEI